MIHLMDVDAATQDTRVKDNEEFSEQFCMTYHPSKELTTITDEILEYTGDQRDPQWMKEEPGRCQSQTFRIYVNGMGIVLQTSSSGSVSSAQTSRMLRGRLDLA